MSRTTIAPDGALVRFDRASVYLRETGAGRPLLLINGLGAHTGMWRAFEGHLSGFRVIEFDLPGAGRSPMPRRPVSVSDLSALTLAIMDHTGLDRPDVLGYSMGGMVAQQFAAEHPERVRRLVLASTTPGIGSVQGDPRALVNIVTPARYLSKRLYSRSIGSMVGGRARHDRDFVTEQARVRLEHRPTWRGYAMQLRSIARWTSLPLLGRITAPTLVVTGADDPLTPVANAELLAYAIPQARAVVVEGEGHLMMVDDQSAALPTVREFLAADDFSTTAAWRDGVEVSAADLRAALAAARWQLPPRSLRDAWARSRWLRLDDGRSA